MNKYVIAIGIFTLSILLLVFGAAYGQEPISTITDNTIDVLKSILDTQESHTEMLEKEMQKLRETNRILALIIYAEHIKDNDIRIYASDHYYTERDACYEIDDEGEHCVPHPLTNDDVENRIFIYGENNYPRFFFEPGDRGNEWCDEQVLIITDPLGYETIPEINNCMYRFTANIHGAWTWYLNNSAAINGTIHYVDLHAGLVSILE